MSSPESPNIIITLLVHSYMKARFQNIYLSLILLLFSFGAYTQNNVSDSLKKALQTQKEDTNKVKLLNTLSYSYAFSSPDTGLTYAQQALDLAEKLNFGQGIFDAEFSLSASLLTLGNYPLLLNYSFKELSLAKKLNQPKEIAIANGMLAECYYNLGEYNTSLQYERAVIKIMEQNFSDKIYFMWIQMSRVFQSMNQPDSALLYARNAYQKIKGTQIPGEISLLFPILGNAFAGKANYDSALFYYTMGIPVAAKYNFGTDLIDNYNGIAEVYKAKGNLDSADWYSKKVLTEKIGKSYPIGLLKAANMLADIYQSKNKPDSTLKIFKNSYKFKR